MNDNSDNTHKSETNVNLSPYPYEKAVEKIADKGVQAAIDGSAAFLNSVCRPALEEVGGILADRFSHWRKLQAIKLATKMQAKMGEFDNRGYIPPRLLETGLDRGSLVDSEELADMWSGLLASSCTPEGFGRQQYSFYEYS